MSDQLRLQNLRAAHWRVRTQATGRVDPPHTLRYRRFRSQGLVPILMTDDFKYVVRQIQRDRQRLLQVTWRPNPVRAIVVGTASTKAECERIIEEHRQVMTARNRYASKRLIR